jgi:hypothetical protein
MNLKIVHDFLNATDCIGYAHFGYSMQPSRTAIENEHIRKINDLTKGWTVLCDFSHTEITESIVRFQGDATIVPEVPTVFRELGNRISQTIGVSNEHSFFQFISLGSDGKVSTHYDAGIPGYVTYKCNICLDGPDIDAIFIDKSPVTIQPGDLYCFEANLYKHWMESNPKPRVHLSYGFIVPIETLGWSPDSPRVRLSNRIWKAFIEPRTN